MTGKTSAPQTICVCCSAAEPLFPFQLYCSAEMSLTCPSGLIISGHKRENTPNQEPNPTANITQQHNKCHREPSCCGAFQITRVAFLVFFFIKGECGWKWCRCHTNSSLLNTKTHIPANILTMNEIVISQCQVWKKWTFDCLNMTVFPNLLWKCLFGLTLNFVASRESLSLKCLSGKIYAV